MLCLLVLLAATLVEAGPHKDKVFQWQFSNNFASEQLPTCGTFPITVKPFNDSVTTLGVPPYYMIAYEVGGTPTISFIGTNATQLSWTVDHAADTQLMLSVIDSEGSTGGIPPLLYDVVTGQSTQCIPSSTDTSFSVTANLTGKLETCQPFGLRITGGVRPFTVTIAVINSPVITNASMGPVDDAYTYANRAEPGTLLLAAVSDASGRWAHGTPVINTFGSTDDECPGIVSSSGSAEELEAEASAARDAADARRRNRIIIGVVVPITVLLIIGIVGAVWWRRRQRNRPTKVEEGQDTTPDPFMAQSPSSDNDGSQILSINNFLSPTGARSPKTPPVLSGFPQPAYNPYDSESQTGTSSSHRPTSSGSGNGRPGFASFPSSSVRRSQKAIEAGLGTASTTDSQFPPPSEAGSERPLVDRSQSFGPESSGAERNQGGQRPQSYAPGENGEIIYQHRDGGGIVRELPPPYADRGERHD